MQSHNNVLSHNYNFYLIILSLNFMIFTSDPLVLSYSYSVCLWD